MNLRSELLVAVPRAALFAFHSDPANLAVLMQGWKGFELLGHEGHIRPGARVRVRNRIGPLRLEMIIEHFLLEPPLCFGERQVRGPFARFEHVHEFAEATGGTTIVDRIDFALPWTLGGRLAERFVAAPELQRFFEFRRVSYRRLVESGILR